MGAWKPPRGGGRRAPPPIVCRTAFHMPDDRAVWGESRMRAAYDPHATLRRVPPHPGV